MLTAMSQRCWCDVGAGDDSGVDVGHAGDGLFMSLMLINGCCGGDCDTNCADNHGDDNDNRKPPCCVAAFFII